MGLPALGGNYGLQETIMIYIPEERTQLQYLHLDLNAIPGKVLPRGTQG